MIELFRRIIRPLPVKASLLPSAAKSASGRLQPFDLLVFKRFERPLLVKADIPGVVRNLHKIDQIGTSALPSEADIQLILAERSANDPK